MLPRLFLILICIGPIVQACGCVEASVQAKREHADVIFRGTIVELREAKESATGLRSMGHDTHKIAIFRVSRVWKGEVGETFEMPAIEETTACIGFWPTYLKIGSDLLVYARRFETEYYTGVCGGHKLVTDQINQVAEKDFEVLGRGEVPRKRK
jgi:hypothetical protein